MKQKRAQMEMVGLVVIVILITLGMLFMAQFALKDSPEKKIFTRKGLAYSTMSALMKTTAPASAQCSGSLSPNSPQLGKDILEDCAKFLGTSDFSEYQCQIEPGVSLHSCVFVELTFTRLLEDTLGSWGKHYEFTSTLVYQDGRPSRSLFPSISTPGGCPGERDTSGNFPIQAENTGLIESVLYICD